MLCFGPRFSICRLVDRLFDGLLQRLHIARHVFVGEVDTGAEADDRCNDVVAAEGGTVEVQGSGDTLDMPFVIDNFRVEEFSREE